MTLRIPLSKPALGKEEIDLVRSVLESGHLAEGEMVRRLEEGFRRITGTSHAVACSNGTEALRLTLLAWGIGKGDEVIVPAFTFVATANAPLSLGARPVFCDIDETFTLDPDLLPQLLTDRTRAVIPVHLYGLPADMERIREECEPRGVRVLGDAAQAVGARLGTKPVGGLADAEAFSLYPTKNITSGEGGMVTTDSEETARAIRSLRNHGRNPDSPGSYDHIRLGFNSRLSDVHAAIGVAQLEKLPHFTEARRRNAQTLTRLLSGTPHLVVPQEPPGRFHVFHQYVVRVGGGLRDELASHLRSKGIGCGVYYPRPLPEYPHLQEFAQAPTPRSKEASKEVLALPVHPLLSLSDLEEVAGEVREFLSQRSKL